MCVRDRGNVREALIMSVCVCVCVCTGEVQGRHGGSIREGDRSFGQSSLRMGK